MNLPKDQPEYWIYLAAIMALQEMASVCHTDLDYDDNDKILGNEVYLVSSAENPELVAIKKDEFERLSPDAKFVIGLVIDPPKELEEVIYSRRVKKSPTKMKLGRILKQKFEWTNLKINRSFKEIQRYLKNL